MISYVLPTRDRPDRLSKTLDDLGRLGDHAQVGGAEVIICDNGSAVPPEVPAKLSSGVPVRLKRVGCNLGAAARNIGVEMASRKSEWVVMLDDDSSPRDTAFLAALARQPEDVAAVMADIHLPRSNRREDGGLPEVFIGCGVALRREIFLDVGGYDHGFGYYAEEYDLAARLMLRGLRMAFEPSFVVDHHKDPAGRDMNVILRRLVRNNGWVMQRYAPENCRRAELREIRSRYRRIASKERAIEGFSAGLVELRATVRAQVRTPMSAELFDRFTGLEAARAALWVEFTRSPFRSATIVDEGKNAWVVRKALSELGVNEVGAADAGEADVLVVGTMSPGPMIDALARRRVGAERVIAPWTMALGVLERQVSIRQPVAA
jgi:GT2 family glycosyltransferase